MSTTADVLQNLAVPAALASIVQVNHAPSGIQTIARGTDQSRESADSPAVVSGMRYTLEEEDISLDVSSAGPVSFAPTGASAMDADQPDTGSSRMGRSLRELVRAGSDEIDEVLEDELSEATESDAVSQLRSEWRLWDRTTGDGLDSVE